VGRGNIVVMDDRGRILIPSDVRRRVGTRLFVLEVLGDGSIVLRPVTREVLGLAGRFEGLVEYGDIEELEERQEELVKKERGV